MDYRWLSNSHRRISTRIGSWFTLPFSNQRMDDQAASALGSVEASCSLTGVGGRDQAEESEDGWPNSADLPIHSMYGIYMCLHYNPPNHPNVGIYGIHGASGVENHSHMTLCWGQPHGRPCSTQLEDPANFRVFRVSVVSEVFTVALDPKRTFLDRGPLLNHQTLGTSKGSQPLHY